MNFTEILQQIKSQLEEIEKKEQANQKEQAELTQNIEQLADKIEQLNREIEEKYRRQSELDREALDLCRLSEELQDKQQKISKIQSFSAEFQGLKAEFAGNQDLLNTLYSSLSAVANFNGSLNLENSSTNLFESDQTDIPEDEIEEFTLNIETIKANLPQAEKLYQQLVAKNLEQYHTYQNLIVNELDLIWCAVAFVVFGKESYRKMSLKYHPDLQGSEQAMQLINTAWEISQEHIKSQVQ